MSGYCPRFKILYLTDNSSNSILKVAIVSTDHVTLALITLPEDPPLSPAATWQLTLGSGAPTAFSNFCRL